VILRVVTGRIRRGDIDDVRRSFAERYRPFAMSVDGLVRFVIGTQPAADGDHRLAVMTIWTDVDAAIRALGGDLRGVRTLDGTDHGASLERVDYYELEEVRTDADDRTPALLRLTVGTVRRGLDAEIQQELRAHLEDLPAEALEAYVGRRVHGGQVEIAFMSTWSEAPAGRDLAAPLWPSIAERYDAFGMDLLDVVLDGSGVVAVVS
jgi:hypothetical protein